MLQTGAKSANFGFLLTHDPLLDTLGALAERYFAEDPSTCLIKLRQFGEVLAQRTAARAGIYTSTAENQADLLARLRDQGLLPREIGDLFHGLRKVGKAAARRADSGPGSGHLRRTTSRKRPDPFGMSAGPATSQSARPKTAARA